MGTLLLFVILSVAKNLRDTSLHVSLSMTNISIARLSFVGCAMRTLLLFVILSVAKNLRDTSLHVSLSMTNISIS